MIREVNGIKPQIDKTAYIYETAEIIGKVKIHKYVSIWPGAVLRGDVEEIIINERTNIQDNVIIHTNFSFPTILGKNVTVGHGAILHGCRIGDNCLIGMGAILLDGVQVGDNCVVGAGSVITENTIVPAGSLILGIPAKVTRKLSKEEIAKLIHAAEHYIDKVKEYRETFRQIVI